MNEAKVLPEDIVKKLEAKKTVTIENMPKRKDAFGKGERNDTLFKLSCALRRQDVSYNATRQILKQLNKTMCKPPLSTKEVKLLKRGRVGLCCHFHLLC